MAQDIDIKLNFKVLSKSIKDSTEKLTSMDESLKNVNKSAEKLQKVKIQAVPESVTKSTEQLNKIMEKFTKSADKSALSYKGYVKILDTARAQLGLVKDKTGAFVKTTKEQVDTLAALHKETGFANKNLDSMARTTVKLTEGIEDSHLALRIFLYTVLVLPGAYVKLGIAIARTAKHISDMGIVLSKAGANYIKLLNISKKFSEVFSSFVSGYKFGVEGVIVGVKNMGQATKRYSTALSVVTKETFSFQKLFLTIGNKVGLVSKSLKQNFSAALSGIDLRIIKTISNFDNFNSSFKELGAKAVGKITKVFSDVRASVLKFTSSLKGVPQSTSTVSKAASMLRNNLGAVGKDINDAGKKINTSQSFFKALSSRISQTTKSIGTFISEGLGNLGINLSSVGNKISGLGATLRGMGSSFVKAAKNTEIFSKGIIGLTTRFSIAGGILGIFGTALLEADSIMAKVTGGGLIALSIALGGIAIVIRQLTLVIGDFITSVGTSLVNAMQKSVDNMAQLEQTTFTFKFIVDSLNESTKGATGSFEEWNDIVQEFSKTQRFAVEVTQRSVSELLRYGTSIGLTKGQMEELLPVIGNLAKANHKDLFQSTLAVVEALGGQTQMLQNMGVNLTEHAILTTKAGDAYHDNYGKLTEVSKTQIRYNALLEKSTILSGLAEASAITINEQLERQEVAWKNISQAMGAGAEIIEQKVNAVWTTLIETLEGFSKPALKSLGFMASLTGRALQVTGQFVKWSFAIVLVTSSIKALNIVLANNTIQKYAGVLAKSTLITQKLASVSTAASTTISSALTSISTKGLSLTSVFQIVKVGFMAVLKQAALLIAPFALVALKIGLVIGAMYLLYKGFQEVERRTKIFSELWADMVKAWNSTGPIMDSVSAGLTYLGKVLRITVLVAIKAVSIVVAQLIINFLLFKERVLNIGRALASMGKWVYEVGTSINKWLIKVVTSAVKWVTELATSIKNSITTNTKFIRVMKFVNDIIQVVKDTFDKIKLAAVQAYTKIKDMLQLEKIAAAAKSAFGSIGKMLSNLSLFSTAHAATLDNNTKKVKEQVKVLTDSQKTILKLRSTQKDLGQDILDLLDGEEKKVTNISKKLTAGGKPTTITLKVDDADAGYRIGQAFVKATDELSLGQKIGYKFFKIIDKISPSATKAVGTFAKNNEGTIGAIGQVADSIGQGAAGARALTAGVATAVGSAFGGPIVGKALGSVVNMLTAPTDEFQKQMNGFLQFFIQLPKLLARNVGVLVRELVAAIPDLINALVDSIPVILDTIIGLLGDPKFWEDVIDALIAAMSALMGNPMLIVAIAKAFVVGIGKGIPAMAIAMGKAIVTKIHEGVLGAAKIFQAVGKAFKTIFGVFAVAINFFLKGVSYLWDKLKSIIDPFGIFTGLFKDAVWVFKGIVDILTAAFHFFVDGLGLIIDGFKLLWDGLKAIFEFFAGIISPLGDILAAFADKLSFVGDIFKGAIDLFSAAINILKEAVDGIKNALSGGIVKKGGSFVSKIGGAVTGTISSVGDFLGFEKGGEIPNRPGFRNDGFGPAFLNAKENVVDASTNTRLKKFLSNQERGNTTNNQPVIIQLQVGEKQLASVLVDLNKSGYRVTA